MPEVARVLPLPHEVAPHPQRAEVTALLEGGLIRVRLQDGREWDAAWLQAGGSTSIELAAHDWVIVLPPAGGHPAVVMGRIGPYSPPAPPARLCIEATEVLTLKCGDATLDLRADGKAVLRGEDVLIRARGLQRIKAGSVSIN
jgi:hypothetical protein